MSSATLNPAQRSAAFQSVICNRQPLIQKTLLRIARRLGDFPEKATRVWQRFQRETSGPMQGRIATRLFGEKNSPQNPVLVDGFLHALQSLFECEGQGALVEQIEAARVQSRFQLVEIFSKITAA